MSPIRAAVPDELEEVELVWPTFTGYQTADWPGSTEETWLAAGAIKQHAVSIPGVLQIRDPWLTERFLQWFLRAESRYLRIAGAILVKPDGAVETFQSSPWERKKSADHWKERARRGTVQWARGSIRRGRLWAIASRLRPVGVWIATIIAVPLAVPLAIFVAWILLWDAARGLLGFRRPRTSRLRSSGLKHGAVPRSD